MCSELFRSLAISLTDFNSLLGLSPQASLYLEVLQMPLSGGSLGLSIADTEKLTSNTALHGTELVPVFGNFVSGVSAVNDVFGKEGVVSSFKACRNGTN